MGSLALGLALTALVGCGRRSDDRSQVAADGTRLTHNGISIEVPPGWEGRILFLDAKGSEAIFQVANFALPTNKDFEPPRPVIGQEDPIKRMAGPDMLIAVDTGVDSGRQRSLPVAIDETSFLAPDSPQIPRGHALAKETGCFGATCLRITVDFAQAPPSQLVDTANGVLSSLSVPADK
jgi:hypothetical protein